MSKRKFIIFDNSTKEQRSIDKGRAIFNQPTNYWPLQVVHSESANFFTSDVSLFLDEKRLAKLNPYDINNMVAGLQNRPKSAQFGDETLFETIPARHLQSVGDVHAFADALEAEVKDAKSRVENKAREIKQMEADVLVPAKEVPPSSEPSNS